MVAGRQRETRRGGVRHQCSANYHRFGHFYNQLPPKTGCLWISETSLLLSSCLMVLPHNADFSLSHGVVQHQDASARRLECLPLARGGVSLHRQQPRQPNLSYRWRGKQDHRSNHPPDVLHLCYPISSTPKHRVFLYERYDRHRHTLYHTISTPKHRVFLYQRTSVPSGEHSTPPASSTNGTRRNATQSIIPTLPTNSSAVPGGTTTTTPTASSVPVTRRPCPTPSSTNGTAPPQPGVSACTSSPSGVVSQCLVAIGLLAALLTVFFVSTMALCAKLSSRKYSLGGQRGTEMVCLSTMMTSHNGTGSRRAHLEGRRTLRTGPEDSDDDDGDNLTLNSFLPEGDRMV
ncbi:unnamed protein product [Boreogadus saida]